MRAMNFVFILIGYLFVQIDSNFSAQTIYTPKEKEALKLFLPAVKDFLYLDYQREDAYLINWLRSKSLDVSSAKAALKRSLQFKRENGIDRILESEEMLYLRKLLPTISDSVSDKAGNPALIALFSNWDLRKAVLSGKGDALRQYPFYLFESFTSVMLKRNATNWILLADMSNYSLRKHACVACLQFYTELVGVYEMHYPRTAKYLVAINTPRIFETPLNLMKSLMNEETKKILKIFGPDRSEWQPFLNELFASEQLIKRHGGTLLKYGP